MQSSQTHYPERVLFCLASNRIFMTLNQPQRSSYKDTFHEDKKSKKEGVQSCKPIAKYTPTAGKLKYKTEYS